RRSRPGGPSPSPASSTGGRSAQLFSSLNSLHCRTQHLMLVRLLNKSDQPKIIRIRFGVELQLNVFGEVLAYLHAANFGQTRDHSYVRETATAVLSSQDFRLDMI